MWGFINNLFTRKNVHRNRKRTGSRKSNKPKEPNRYLTVNNGSHHWIVEDHPAEKRVVIYKNNVSPDGEVKVTEIPYKTLWLSHPDGRRYTEFALSGGQSIQSHPAKRDGEFGPWHKGNTVLIQTSDNCFIFVYDDIHEFKLKSGDEPVKFVSKIGNNDSPYPYLIGKHNVYTMWDTSRDTAYCYPKESFDLTKDIISQELGGDGPTPGRSDIKLKKLFSPCDCRWRGSTNCGKPCRKTRK